MISKEEAKSLLAHTLEVERIWENDPKVRRQKFEELYKSRDLRSICQLIKSLHLQNEDLKKIKKSLSMLDKDFLDKLLKDVVEELSLVLEVSLEEAKKIFEETLC